MADLEMVQMNINSDDIEILEDIQPEDNLKRELRDLEERSRVTINPHEIKVINKRQNELLEELYVLKTLPPQVIVKPEEPVKEPSMWDFHEKTIKIKFDTYKIIVEEDVLCETDNGEYSLGYICDREEEIHLTAKMSYTRGVQVLIHEVVHGAAHGMGLHGYAQIDDELVAHVGSTELMWILKDNPWLRDVMFNFIKNWA